MLAPALRGDLPSNLLIYGKIGTGKTAVVAQVRQDILRRSEPRVTSPSSPSTAETWTPPTACSRRSATPSRRTESDRIPTGWSLDRVQADDAPADGPERRHGHPRPRRDRSARRPERRRRPLHVQPDQHRPRDSPASSSSGSRTTSSSRTTWTPASAAVSTRRRSSSPRTTRCSCRTSCASGRRRPSGTACVDPGVVEGAPRTPRSRTGTLDGPSRSFGSPPRWPSATARSGSPPTTS